MGGKTGSAVRHSRPTLLYESGGCWYLSAVEGGHITQVRHLRRDCRQSLEMPSGKTVNR